RHCRVNIVRKVGNSCRMYTCEHTCSILRRNDRDCSCVQPKFYALGAGTFRADGAARRRRLAEQETRGIACLSGLHVTAASTPGKTLDVAVGFSFRGAGEAKLAAGAVQAPPGS